MRQAHSQEIGRVVKAKDRIIEDLKSSNHKLQARVPGSEVSRGMPCSGQYLSVGPMCLTGIIESIASDQSENPI